MSREIYRLRLWDIAIIILGIAEISNDAPCLHVIQANTLAISGKLLFGLVGPRPRRWGEIFTVFNIIAICNSIPALTGKLMDVYCFC